MAFKIELLRLNDNYDECMRKYYALLKYCITAFLTGLAMIALVAIAYYSNIDLLKTIFYPIGFVVVTIIVIGNSITIGYMFLFSIVKGIKEGGKAKQ